jgi:hypothetical protein
LISWIVRSLTQRKLAQCKAQLPYTSGRSSICPAYCVSCRRATPGVWKDKECGISWAAGPSSKRELLSEMIGWHGCKRHCNRFTAIFGTWSCLLPIPQYLGLPALCRLGAGRCGRGCLPTREGATEGSQCRGFLWLWSGWGSGKGREHPGRQEPRLGLHHRTHPGTLVPRSVRPWFDPSTTLTVIPRRPLPSSHCLCVLIVPTCSRPRAHDLCFGYSHFQICPIYQIHCIAGVLSWYFVFSVGKVVPTLASLPRNRRGSLVWARTNSICASPRHLCLPCS